MINEKIVKKRLEIREKELNEMSNISADSRNPVKLDQPAVGRLSRMDALQQQEMNKATEQKRQNDLARIEIAKRKLNNGEYGLCTNCGGEIAEKRLEIDPIAEKCIECAGM